MSTVPARDGCVVDSEPLAGLLNGFVQEWNRTRSADAGRYKTTPRMAGRHRSEVAQVRVLEYLATETGLSEGTIEKLLHRDSTTGRLSPRTRSTELRIADPLVTVIGCPEVFHDGTLQIRENPQAAPEDRAACCRGSLTGRA